MKPEIHLIKLQAHTIYEQLQLEEALLRTDSRNFCLIQEGAPDAIVTGISGKPEKLLNLPLLEKKPVPIIKRFSGGGTVFVDHNTFFISFICGTSAFNVSACPNNVFCWSGAFYRDLFEGYPFHLHERDYIFDGRKFGGSAQYLCKDRWLHHSSLLWDYSDENMDYLLLPERRPKYREDRPHRDFLCKLSHYLNSREDLHSRFNKTLAKHFDVKEIDLSELKSLSDRPHRKSTIHLE